MTCHSRFPAGSLVNRYKSLQGSLQGRISYDDMPELEIIPGRPAGSSEQIAAKAKAAPPDATEPPIVRPENWLVYDGSFGLIPLAVKNQWKLSETRYIKKCQEASARRREKGL